MSCSIMHGKRIHFQKPNFFNGVHCSCPADDRRAPGGRAVRPVEATLSCMELDPAKRPTQGHDLPRALAGSGTKGRHRASTKETHSFQEPFPSQKPAGADGDRPQSHREAFAQAFSHFDSPGEKKPPGKAVQQPYRGAPLSGVLSARWRAPQVHGFFRGPGGGMPCLLLRGMASWATGSFHRLDTKPQGKESPFTCLQYPLFDSAMGPVCASCLASFGPMLEAAFKRLGNALFSSSPLG